MVGSTMNVYDAPSKRTATHVVPRERLRELVDAERERDELRTENDRLTKAYRHVEEQEHKLREGIKYALDILNRVHLYDSPEYRYLEGLIDE